MHSKKKKGLKNISMRLEGYEDFEEIYYIDDIQNLTEFGAVYEGKKVAQMSISSGDSSSFVFGSFRDQQEIDLDENSPKLITTSLEEDTGSNQHFVQTKELTESSPVVDKPPISSGEKTEKVENFPKKLDEMSNTSLGEKNQSNQDLIPTKKDIGISNKEEKQATAEGYTSTSEKSEYTDNQIVGSLGSVSTFSPFLHDTNEVDDGACCSSIDKPIKTIQEQETNLSEDYGHSQPKMPTTEATEDSTSNNSSWELTRERNQTRANPNQQKKDNNVRGIELLNEAAGIIAKTNDG